MSENARPVTLGSLGPSQVVALTMLGAGPSSARECARGAEDDYHGFTAGVARSALTRLAARNVVVAAGKDENGGERFRHTKLGEQLFNELVEVER